MVATQHNKTLYLYTLYTCGMWQTKMESLHFTITTILCWQIPCTEIIYWQIWNKLINVMDSKWQLEMFCSVVYFKSNFIKIDRIRIYYLIYIYEHYTENHIANEFNNLHCTQWLFNFKTNYVNCTYEKLRTVHNRHTHTHRANMLIISIYMYFGSNLCKMNNTHTVWLPKVNESAKSTGWQAYLYRCYRIWVK